MDLLAYLGVGVTPVEWPGPDAPPLAGVTYVLGADGLIAHVAGLGPLPLDAWPDAAPIPGLSPIGADVAGTVAAAARRASDAPRPSPAAGGALPPVAYAVARDGDAFPALFGDAGAQGLMEPPAVGTFVWGADAVVTWLRKEGVLDVLAPMAGFHAHIPGLRPAPAGVILSVPPVPRPLLDAFVVEAWERARDDGHEILWHLCWDGHSWGVDRPAQHTGPDFVAYPSALPPGAVATLHSHGRGRTYFSVTDDTSEENLHINVVVGDLQSPEGPAMLCRTRAHGAPFVFPARMLFAGPPVARDLFREGVAPRIGTGASEVDLLP